MNIWLIYPYGSMPGEGLQPDRASMIASALDKAGHNVIWWGSNIEHRSKTIRTSNWKEIEITPGFHIRVVPSIKYSKNISLRRILYEIKFGKQVYLRSKECAPPDVIIMGEPSFFFYKPILKIINEFNVKLILDRLDLWPELFHMTLPKSINRFGKYIFAPLYKRRRFLLNQADGIMAVSNTYLELALSELYSSPMENTATVYFGIDVSAQRNSKDASIELPLTLTNIKKKTGEIWAIYASTLGHNYDLSTLLKTAELLQQKDINIKILIAGTGPLTQYMISYIESKNLKNVLYVGNPNSEIMAKVLSFCDIGLSMYRKDSTVTMPIKVFHYFAAGLLIINSLKGDIAEILTSNNAGVNFAPEDSENLFSILQMISLNPEKISVMKNNSYNLASLYDINIQYAKVVKLVNELMNSKKQ